MRQEKLDRLHELLEESIKEGEIAGGNLAVLVDGKEVYYTEAGMADIKGNKPVKRDTIFRLYSMSKPITATAAYILIERGKLDLLDPVSKFIPEFKNMTVVSEKGIENQTREIKIKDLLNMTSGLCYGGENNLASSDVQAIYDDIINRLYTDNQVSTSEFANRMGHVRLAFQPGEEWKYGTSADILGAVIERASGMTFGEFLNKELFIPLGMKDTGFNVKKENLNRLSKVYDKSNEGLVEYDFSHLGICNHMDVENRFESGGAGLVSTIDDYAKFTQMLLNGGSYEGKEYLSKKTVEFMTSSHVNTRQQKYVEMWDNLPGFSYGNFLRVCVDPSQTVYNCEKGEYGWDGWLGCYFENIPGKKCTFLLMVQKAGAGTFDLTRKCRNVLAGEL